MLVVVSPAKKLNMSLVHGLKVSEPYFTIIVPIAQLKPADKVIRKPNIFSKTLISKDRKIMPVIPKINEIIIDILIFS